MLLLVHQTQQAYLAHWSTDSSLLASFVRTRPAWPPEIPSQAIDWPVCTNKLALYIIKIKSCCLVWELKSTCLNKFLHSLISWESCCHKLIIWVTPLTGWPVIHQLKWVEVDLLLICSDASLQFLILELVTSIGGLLQLQAPPIN